MSIILQDPIHLESPSRSPVRPAAPLDPRTASGSARSPSNSNPEVAIGER
jgi:hypothetical protein